MRIKLAPNFKIDAQLVMTGRGCIIGQSGSGKSFLIGIIGEELSRLHLPFCIVDIEGEYAALKKHFGAIVIGGSNRDFGFDGDLSPVLLKSIHNGKPIILDLSEETGKSSKVYRVLEKIYALEEKLRKPYLIMIEEADRFVPQVTHKKINIIEELGVRGRKRGIGLIVATQRPSIISKNVLSQCTYGFIGKLGISNDLNSVKKLFGDRKKLKEIAGLNMGEFMPFGSDDNDKFQVRITGMTQKGATPLIGGKNKRRADGLIGSFNSKTNSQKRSSLKGKKKITAFSLKFITNDAHVYARKIATRRFGIFGRPIEQPESIKITYVGANLCMIRMPTKKKHELEEYAFLMDNNLKLIRFSKGVRLEDNKIGRPKTLSPIEIRLLGELRERRKIHIDKIDTLGIGSKKEIGEALRRLASFKLIAKDAKNVYAENYNEYLMRELPEVESAYVPNREIDNKRISKDEARAYASTLYPNSFLIDLHTIYIPVYEIILRHKNKIRTFKIDGIYGKEVADA